MKGAGTLLTEFKKNERSQIHDEYLKIRNSCENETYSKIIDGKTIYKTDIKKDLIIRKKILKLFKNQKIIQLKNNECVVILTRNDRDETFCAFHSEPKMNEPRLFLSILPGTFDEITNLKKRREQISEIK